MSRRIWMPTPVSRTELMRGLGAAEVVPVGITFPSQADYMRTTSQGVYGLSSMPIAELQQVVTPAGKTAAIGLGSIIESATGSSLGSLISSNLPSGKVVDTFRNVVGDVIDGTLELVIATVTKAVANALSGVLEVVPVIGTILGAVIDVFVGMYNWSDNEQANARASREQTKYAAMQKLKLVLDPWCRAELALAQTDVVATSPGGAPTPADMFRPIYYRWKSGGGKLPLTPMSLIVMLCGPEADGWAFTQDSYDKFIGEARTGAMYDYAEVDVAPNTRDRSERYRWHDRFVGMVDDDNPDHLEPNPGPGWSNEIQHLNDAGLMRGLSRPCEKQVDRNGQIVPDPGLGLKPNVRRRIWELVRAIFSATQNPAPESFSRWGDGGRTAMVLLVDILFRHYEPVARNLFGDNDGYWTPYLAKCMEHRVTTLYRMSKSSIDPESDRRYRAVGSCPVNLKDQLVGFMNAYKEQFIPQFLDQNGNWIAKPRFMMSQVPAKSMLKMSKSATTKLVNKLQEVPGSTVSNGQRAMLAAAGLSGSYLLYRGAKFAQHRRRR